MCKCISLMRLLLSNNHLPTVQRKVISHLSANLLTSAQAFPVTLSLPSDLPEVFTALHMVVLVMLTQSPGFMGMYSCQNIKAGPCCKTY